MVVIVVVQVLSVVQVLPRKGCFLRQSCLGKALAGNSDFVLELQQLLARSVH